MAGITGSGCSWLCASSQWSHQPVPLPAAAMGSSLGCGLPPWLQPAVAAFLPDLSWRGRLPGGPVLRQVLRRLQSLSVDVDINLLAPSTFHLALDHIKNKQPHLLLCEDRPCRLREVVYQVVLEN